MEYTRDYTCTICKGHFTDNDDWDEDQMRAEQKDNAWDHLPDEAMMRVCDDCYKKVMAVRN